ncbi:MBL fold metallo-hydrolase [Aureimonas populi]|uniref:MBL fold metallo-hydrolase n=1 Tax=Aureimonas populi TaxID=1701758 RepID=A0ABW5CIL3_9HYPH|nr:MBL fold metallo-hydrolase [Aureimonas populi]
MDRRRILRLLTAGALATLSGGAAARSVFSGNRYYKGPVSDHFDGRVFFNPGGEEPLGFADLMRWRLSGERETWPARWPEDALEASPAARVEGESLRVTMVGHATMLIQTAGLNILTDPVFSERASPASFAGPRRVNRPGIAFDALPPIDIVLVSHNHYDHLDVDTLARLAARHDPLVVTPLGNDTIIRARAPGMRIEVLDWGGALSHGGATIHCEPAHHWSARGLTDRRMALWAAFVIETPAGKIYHIGDTGFGGGSNYRDAREKHGGFRLALLPIGAYEPRWFMSGQHQNPAEAVEGMRLAGARFAAGHHWGTFQLTDEGITRPLDALRAALASSRIEPDRFRPLRPGEAWDVPD